MLFYYSGSFSNLNSSVISLRILVNNDIAVFEGLCSCVAKSLLLGGAEKDTADLPVGDVSLWWKGVRDILAQSILIGQSLIMAIVCRSVAMEVMAAIQKVKVSFIMLPTWFVGYSNGCGVRYNLKCYFVQQTLTYCRHSHTTDTHIL